MLATRSRAAYRDAATYSRPYGKALRRLWHVRTLTSPPRLASFSWVPVKTPLTQSLGGKISIFAKDPREFDNFL